LHTQFQYYARAEYAFNTANFLHEPETAARRTLYLCQFILTFICIYYIIRLQGKPFKAVDLLCLV